MIKFVLLLFQLSFEGDAALNQIVLEPSLDSRLRRIAVSTANTKKNNAPFRHLLLHGPPGTGEKSK